MKVDKYWAKGHPSALLLHAALPASQFLLAIIIAALYGVDLHNATNSHNPGPTPWVYTEVVAALSVLTCAGYCFMSNKRATWFIWDFVLFILWVALFGVFGSIYIGGKDAGYAGVTSSVLRMKIAVWFDLLGMIIWFSSSVKAVVGCCTKCRGTRGPQKEGVALERDAQALRATEIQPDEEIIELMWRSSMEIGDGMDLKKELHGQMSLREQF